MFYNTKICEECGDMPGYPCVAGLCNACWPKVKEREMNDTIDRLNRKVLELQAKLEAREFILQAKERLLGEAYKALAKYKRAGLIERIIGFK